MIVIRVSRTRILCRGPSFGECLSVVGCVVGGSSVHNIFVVSLAVVGVAS